MNAAQTLDVIWVPALLSVICFYYAWCLLKKKDISKIRPKGAKALGKKKSDAYAHDAGVLMRNMGIASALTIPLALFTGWIFLMAVALIFLIFAFRWKKVVEAYE
jgi:hypothetical protein